MTMLQVKFLRRYAQYRVGEVTWLHDSLAGPMVRAGFVALDPAVMPPVVAREEVIETAVQAPAPERAVTRRKRR